MMRAYRQAIGRMAEVEGADWVNHDIKQHIFRHEAVARRCYPALPRFYRQASEAFIAGLKQFMTENPQCVPEFAIDIEPFHIMALARAVRWSFIIRQAYSDLGLDPELSPEDGLGSNAWAISPHKTVDNSILFCSDPHVPWTDEWMVHECHLHGGDLHVYGFQTPGLPYVTFGHNEHLAWAYTSGAGDVADVYELTLNPDDQLFYQYDGAWRNIHVETFFIQSKTENGLQTIPHAQAYSHLGPIMVVENGKAYAFRTAYDEVLFDHIEPHAALNKAKSVSEAHGILARRQFGPYNLLLGDRQGDTYFQMTGRIPMRDAFMARFQFQPIPATSSAVEWRNIHPTSELPQLNNPPNGWIQHANIAPWMMIPNSPLTTDNYPPYMLMGEKPTSHDGSNPRGRYLYERLSKIDKMTLDEAFSLATDTYMAGAQPFLKAIVAIYEHNQDQLADIAPAIQILQDWNGDAHQDSVGMTLFWEWYLAFLERSDDASIAPNPFPFRKGEVERGDFNITDRILQNNTLTPFDQQLILDAVEDAVQYLTDQWGRLDIPWGQVYRMRCGSASWAVNGGVGLNLRVIGAWDPDEDGVYTPNFGSICPLVVCLNPDRVQSWSAFAFGQSDDPDSPHYIDQGQQLFAHGKLKPTHFSREALPAQFVTAREVLIYQVDL
jgi:acyl-homoserine-lactone acylase